MKKLLQTHISALFIGLILLSSCNSINTTSDKSRSENHTDILFIHANLVPMDKEEVLENQTLWIRDGKIHKIGQNLDYPSDAKIIEAKDKYIMPGISEMHAHIPVPNGEDDALVKETLFLYVANGITTIRGMLGQAYHLELKKQVDKGEILSPRVYTSGTSVNGTTVPSIEEADKNIRAQKEAGYDFLKLHPGLKREVFDEVVKTAKEVGILYAGHVSIDVGIKHALNSDYASVDHLDGYIEGLVPASAGLAPDANGFFGFNFADHVDLNLMDELASLTARKGVAVVPTQSLFSRWASPKSPDDLAADPEMKYMNPRTVATWKQGKFSLLANKDYTEARYEKFLVARHHILNKLHEAKALFLLGSDAPQVFNVPGYSIHHEIQSIVDAGISPYEVLKSGTVNPAIFFNQEGDYGTITTGAAADLILLKEDPLQNPGTIRENLGVMLRGQWLSREEIDEKLASIEKKYAEMEKE